jgi:hypothetical protein
MGVEFYKTEAASELEQHEKRLDVHVQAVSTDEIGNVFCAPDTDLSKKVKGNHYEV